MSRRLRRGLRQLGGWPLPRELAAVLFLLGLTLAFYRDILFGDQAIANLRLVLETYPYRDYVSHLLSEGHIPLWNPYLFAGAPLLAEPSVGVLYPLNMLGVLWEAPQAVAYAAVGHAFLGATFMYILARASLGVGAVAALVAALAYALGGFMPARLGQPEVTAAAAWLPLVLLCADQASRRANPALLALGGFAMAMQALSGGLYVLYISLFALFVLGACRLIASLASAAAALARPGRGRWLGLARWLGSNGWLAVVFLGLPALAFGLAAVQLVPTWELWQRSLFSDGRPYDVATAASLPPADLLQALLPGFRDNPPGNLIAFVGIIPLGLALLAIARRPRQMWTWLFFVFAGTALVLAVGSHNPAMPWLFDHIPWLNRFRGPTTWLLLYALAAAGLAGMGAEVVVRGGLWREMSGLGWRLWHNGLWPFLSLAIPAAGLATAVLLLRQHLVLPQTEVRQVWIALALIAFDIIYILPMLRLGPWPGLAVTLLVAGELILAGARLPAFDTLATAAVAPPATIAGLLSDGPQPSRVLSRVDAEVATAEESPAFATIGADEVLAYGQALLPNLTLRYGLATLEGLEGELLPLASYPRTAELLESPASTVGELSSALGLSPPLLRERADVSRLDVLAALNVGYIVEERNEGDIRVEGARFDLRGEAVAGPGLTVVVERMPSLAADTVALVSYLDEGALALPQDSFVGTVTLTGWNGVSSTFLLRAGVDTAVGPFEANKVAIRHQQAPALAEDPKRPGTLLYVALIPSAELAPLRQVSIQNLLGEAALHIRALSLLDRDSGTSEPVMLDQRLSRRDVGRFKLYRLEAALPRAFLVQWYKVVAGDAALAEALPGSIGDTVFFVPPPPLTPQQAEELSASARAAATSKTKVTLYEPERVVVTTASAGSGFLVLTDAYYPGWRASVDGEETPMLEADGMFRAVYVPAGKHGVEFRYEPQSFSQGVKVSLYSSAAAAGLVLVTTVWSVRRYLTRILRLRRLR